MELPLFLSLFLTLFFLIISRLVYLFLWNPWMIRLHFRRQGISGPPLRPLFGNATEIVAAIKDAQAKPLAGFHHDVVGRVLPHYSRWAKLYGAPFLFWFGNKPRLAVSDPALVREVLLNPKSCFERVEFNPLARQLIGDGLVGITGKTWLRHKRIINAAFQMDQIKGMVSAMVASSEGMLEAWEKRLEGGVKEVEVHKELHILAADIISRTAFGSSYEEGKRIFSLQDEQTLLVSQALRTVYIPGFRFIPTRKNRERWRIENEIRRLLRELIATKKAESAMEKSTNLLGLMLSSNSQEREEQRMGMEEIVDECKTFYFAGKETTGNLLTWSVLLLGLHREWQSKARQEVINVCGHNGRPNAESLSQLKTVEMVLKEALRLYSPAVFLQRRACKDVKLGSLHVPAGTQLYLPTLAIHHDSKLWGEDASEFNPARFSNESVTNAPFFPFGLGSRVCIGQNLAMAEGKVVLAMILQRFYLDVSPLYAHAPMLLMTLQPQLGAQVLLERVLP